MNTLNIRVIPVYHDEAGGAFAGMVSKAVDSGMDKYIQPKIEVK